MMASDKTYCPYCGTANLAKTQLMYIDPDGTAVFQCQLCKHDFTDYSIQEQVKEELQTTQNVKENA